MFSLPWSLIAQHGVEDGNYLAHAGGQRDFLVLTCGDQALRMTGLC
jgi:hypothetical protein